MSRRATTICSLALLVISLICVALVFWADTTLDDSALWLTPLLAYAVVGALVAARRPHNAIGWLYSAIGLCLSLAGVGAALKGQPPLDGLVWAALTAAIGVLAALGWYLALGLALTFGLLLFPTGRLPSPRWRPAAWLAAAGIVLMGIADQLSEADGAPLAGDGALAVFNLISLGVLIVAVLASAASLIVRFRRSHGQERQQLKWIAAAAGLVAFWAVASFATDFAPGAAGTSVVLVIDIALPLSVATIPIAAGIAVLRHRLYAIDLIIRRTALYGALTATLAAVYLGGVVLLQAAFRMLIGQESDLAIVAATLAVAALALPLRQRIQAAIDRRRYDAIRTLAAFSAALRDEVDLDRLTDELARAADETMRPDYLSLWLRAPEAGR